MAAESSLLMASINVFAVSRNWSALLAARRVAAPTQQFTAIASRVKEKRRPFIFEPRKKYETSTFTNHWYRWTIRYYMMAKILEKWPSNLRARIKIRR